MVHDGQTARGTGFSSLESAETNVESGIMRRGGGIADLDLERNNSESDDYEGHGSQGRKFWKIHMRPPDDDLPQDWWFASTAIPLLAATIGPLANVCSIAALVTTWRVTLPDNGQLPLGKDENGIAISDPHWEIICNAISLGCGFAGNLALLLNFTRRTRYIVALPLSIIFWYLATGILIAITVAMNEFAAPIRPGQTYSQGYWYAIISAVLYLFGSMILMINMMGYFLGHYPQHFELDDDQRTLILQTMMFFIWLSGGAGVFHAVCGFSFVDALYFCDVTVLTVGFGDFVANNDTGRGLIFPYSVGGIIFLGLVINSIRNFAIGMSRDNIIKKHQRRERERTVGRTVTSENELRARLGLPPPRRSSETRRHSVVVNRTATRSQNRARGNSLSEFGTLEQHGVVLTFRENTHENGHRNVHRLPMLPVHRKPTIRIGRDSPSGGGILRQPTKREKLLMLREEKDRFDAMRQIQQNTRKFKQYYALSMSVMAFGILWCVGALVFMFAERRQQNLSYFEALYFCYVSLLTIGYGDFSPQSNAGKPFFVIWSLIAVPTMTILISDMGDTVISAIKRGTFTLGDWTVLPRVGVWHDFLVSHPKLLEWIQRKQQERAEKKRIARGFELNNPDENPVEPYNPLGTTTNPLTLEELAKDGSTDHDLARKLALSIRKVANDLKTDRPNRYSYEEWVEFTRLIRFSSRNWGNGELEVVEEEEGLVEWDWIGENSPMLADESEPQWVLDRLCESLNRYTRRQAAKGREEVEEVQEEEEDIRSEHARIRRSDSSSYRSGQTLDQNGHLSGSHREEDNPESPGHIKFSHESARPVFPMHPSGHENAASVVSGERGDRDIDPVIFAEEEDKLKDGDPDTRT